MIIHTQVIGCSLTSIKGWKTSRKSAKNQGAPESITTEPGARLAQTPMMNMSLDLGIGDTVTHLLALFKVLEYSDLNEKKHNNF